MSAHHGAARPGRHPLQGRRRHGPDEQHVGIEQVEAARRVASEAENAEQRDPRERDVDGGGDQAVVEAVAAGEGEGEDQQAQRERGPVHGLVGGRGRCDEREDGDARLEQGGDEGCDRLRRTEENPLVRLVEHVVGLVQGARQKQRGHRGITSRCGSLRTSQATPTRFNRRRRESADLGRTSPGAAPRERLRPWS